MAGRIISIFLGWQVLFVLTCSQNSDCNSVGKCVQGSCQCPFGYSGTTCDYHYTVDKNWLAAYYAMGAFGSFLNIITLSWAIYQLKIKLKFNRSLIEKWTLLHTILMIVTFASIIRVIWGVLDPRSIRGILPKGVEAFFYYVPIILLLEIDFTFIVLWTTLLRTSGVKKVNNTRESKIIMLAYFVVSTVILAAVVIYEIISDDSKLSSILTPAAVGVFLLVLSVFGIIAGTKLKALLQDMMLEENTSKKVFRIYRVTLIIISSNVLLLLFMVLVGVDIALGSFASPNSYIAFQFIFRVGEFIFQIIVLFMTRKLSPRSYVVESTVSTEQPSNDQEMSVVDKSVISSSST